MAISTYSELQSAVENWLARTDQTARVPEFISLAEGRINRVMYPTEAEVRATISTTAGDEFTTLPTDLRVLRLVKLNNSPNVVLDYYAPEQFYDQIPGKTQGVPSVYTVLGRELVLRPIPDDSYTLEINYIKGVPALSDSNTTTTLLSRSPDVYLYGALAEAHRFLMDEKRAVYYGQLFDKAIEEVRIDEERARFGTSPVMKPRVVA